MNTTLKIIRDSSWLINWEPIMVGNGHDFVKLTANDNFKNLSRGSHKLDIDGYKFREKIEVQEDRDTIFVQVNPTYKRAFYSLYVITFLTFITRIYFHNFMLQINIWHWFSLVPMVLSLGYLFYLFYIKKEKTFKVCLI